MDCAAFRYAMLCPCRAVPCQNLQQGVAIDPGSIASFGICEKIPIGWKCISDSSRVVVHWGFLSCIRTRYMWTLFVPGNAKRNEIEDRTDPAIVEVLVLDDVGRAVWKIERRGAFFFRIDSTPSSARIYYFKISAMALHCIESD